MRWPNRMQGTSLLVNWLNRLLDKCRQSEIIEGTDYTIERSPSGSILKFRIGGGSAAPGVSFRALHFKQSFKNYIMTTENIAVAKPPKLRNSITTATIYGVVINYAYPHNVAGDSLYGVYRVASSPNTTATENEGVNPQYLLNDLIIAYQLNTGVVSETGDTTQPVGTPVTWQDSNDDGRAWTRFSNPAF